ncbi:hypothetical protein RF11_04898 [Thelohanellus kitauei]|uniref:Uncharacterized protein n=1 Tax=Thelohanellus kitauei TaxID=669202 RepID=A0A0C2MNT5_THEKT|nr:hypothetical protein RF11_04898 [Thelohanellus kitauei]
MTTNGENISFPPLDGKVFSFATWHLTQFGGNMATNQSIIEFCTCKYKKTVFDLGIPVAIDTDEVEITTIFKQVLSQLKLLNSVLIVPNYCTGTKQSQRIDERVKRSRLRRSIKSHNDPCCLIQLSRECRVKMIGRFIASQ